MTQNYYGIVVSLVLIVLVLGISTLLQKKNILNEEGTRKFVHISVSNYWLIAMYFFSNSWWASLVPLLFIIVNYLSYRYSFISAMERSDQEKASLGTVYYPISLTVLSLFTFSQFSSPYVGAIGILSMGYGDGLAGIVGSQWGKKKLSVINRQKTILGTFTMFVVTFLVITGLLFVVNKEHALLIALFLAAAGTLIELISPNGTDNLTLPLGLSFLYQLLFY